MITASEFHPKHCNTFVYSSSKGTIRLCDMRAAALCDQHAKSEFMQITPPAVPGGHRVASGTPKVVAPRRGSTALPETPDPGVPVQDL